MTLSNQKIMEHRLFVIIISCFLLSCSAHSISSVNKEQFIDYKKNINYSNGNDCLAMKKYDQAIESFSKAIDDIPNCDECYLKRGIANRLAWREKSKIGPYLTYSRHHVHISTYYLKDAIKDFTTAIKYNPKNYEAYHRRALIKLESNGEFRDVIDDLNHVLDLNPRVQRLYCLRGYAWDQLGKQSYLKAKEYYNNAIYDYLKSNDIDHKTCYSRLESPDFCHTMGDFDLAIQYYSKIIETNPSQENAYALLALAYYEKKEFSKVILTIEKKYSCLDRIVSCFTGKEEYAQAIEFINMVINNINNENLRRRCLYRRAQAKYDKGDCTDALSDFNKSLPNGPTNILESGFLNKLKEKMNSKK